MNILAIDFSSKLASVAVFSDGKPVATLTSDKPGLGGSGAKDSRGSQGKQTKPVGASALLTPLVHATIEQSGLEMSDFGLVALPVGPGLFTGLRVAVVTAKTFAYATGADVIGVNTLEVLAAKAAASESRHDGPIQVAVNAQRQQLFTGQYRATGDWQVQQICDNQLVDQPAWVESWAAGDLVSGSGLKLVNAIMDSDETATRGIKIADQAVWDCDADSVAEVALRHYENGRRDDQWTLKPLYFRPSAAEEMRMARMNANG